VNERIAQLLRLCDGPKESLFVCECANDGCDESVVLTQAEYEAVREHGHRFVVRAGHERPDIEHVIDGNSRFTIVEKDGAAREVAIGRDLRARRASDGESRRARPLLGSDIDDARAESALEVSVSV
jgi:hypothetical protein